MRRGLEGGHGGKKEEVGSESGAEMAGWRVASSATSGPVLILRLANLRARC
jgi:hypothetical protein